MATEEKYSGVEEVDYPPLEDSEVDNDVVIPEPDESEYAPGENPYNDPNHPGQDEEAGADSASPRQLASFVRSGAEAIRWALSKTSWHPSGMCLQFSRSVFNVSARYGTASEAWRYAQKRHLTTNPANIPKGVPVFWVGGSRGYGHVAVSLGNGLARSTDWPARTRVGTVRIADIQRYWGQQLVGWTEDINGVTVWEAPPSLPIINAANVARAARGSLAVPRGRLLKRAVRAEVGRGTMNMRSKRLGRSFRKQYKLVQAKYLKSRDVPITPQNTDGIPGVTTLKWLGRRHGFHVV